MKLRSKIQHSMIMVITVTLLAAYALTTLVIYRQNVGLMEQETRQEANYIVKAIEISGTDYLKQMDEVEKNTRITLIDPAGDVLYDSTEDAVTLQNHKNRPEIKAAHKNGTGQEIRRSMTMSKEMFYYAKLLPDGNVLRIGASTVPAQYILPNVMSTFHAEYPGEKLKLFETDSKGVIDMILSHHIDIGFTGTVIEKGNCKYLPFYEDELVVLTPSNKKFVEKLCGGQILADWIMDEPVILREEGSGTKKEAEKMLAEQGIDMKKLKLAALMENQETIKRSVSKGMGVTILSKLAAEEELKNGTLLAFPLGSQGGKRMINLVYDAEYPLLPAAERFIKMIKRMYLKKENTGIVECK